MAAIPLGQAAPKTVVVGTENGEPVNFVVMHSGAYAEGDGGMTAEYAGLYSGIEDCTFVIRQDCPHEGQTWDSNSHVGFYNGTFPDQWIVNTYIPMLSEELQGLLVDVTIPAEECSAWDDTHDIDVLVRSAFLASVYEINDIWPDAEDRIANFNGAPRPYLTRDFGISGNYDRLKGFTVYGGLMYAAMMDEYGYRPVLALSSSRTWVTEDGRLVANTAPAITGSDEDAGMFAEVSPTYAYTVTDLQEDTVSVKEELDGEELRSFEAVLGQENTLTIPADVYRRTLNGSHTLTVTAEDSVGAQTVRTVTFTKNVTSCAFTQTESFSADDRPTRCTAQIHGEFPAGCALKVEACNNGNDASPAWEDVTQPALLGQRYFFKNEEKTAESWGVRFRASLERGTAEGDCFISSIGGVFQ